MKILFVASECAPMAKVGGLADVVGSLPKFIKNPEFDVSVVLPFYESIDMDKKEIELAAENIPVIFENEQEKFNLWKTFLPGSRVPLYLIENKKHFSGKGVYIMPDASSGGSRGEASRFLFLSASATEVAGLMKADIMHCHDWHTAIIPSLFKKRGIKIKTLITIHNLAYQGIFTSDIVNEMLGTEYSGEVNSLREGILNADFINTVSPSYADEIQTREYGFGLEDVLQEKRERLTGIINGLDDSQFNPEKDPFICQEYSWENIEKKAHNKAYLQKIFFGHESPEIPIIGMVTRLAEQKGIDLIMEIMPDLVKKNIQFILLGEGMGDYENYFLEAHRKYSEKFEVKIAFDEELAHQIYAGADIFLMPSHFEPCGLGQQIAMKYGTVPAARATGGIKDTVSPVKITEKGVEGNGFLFKNYGAREFLMTIEETLGTYEKRKDIWKKVQLNGMKRGALWKESAEKYKSLYKKITGSD